MCARGIIWTSRLWEAPTWIGFIFLAYMVPQAIYIERDGTFENFAGWMVWIYISLCLFAFHVGFVWARKKKVGTNQLSMRPIQDKKLLWRAAFVLFLGAVSLIRVREMAVAAELGSQWTGVITFFYLIFQCIFMALAVGTMRWLEGYRRAWLVILIVALLFAAIAIGANAKRSLTAEVFFVLGALGFFVRGWTLPRALVISLLISAVYLLHQIDEVRAYVFAGKGNAFEAVMDGVPFQDLNYFEPTKAPELTHAVVDIYAARQRSDYVGPAPLWNRMVHQYVPAFLVGREIKDGLKIQSKSDFYGGFNSYDWFGATRTGFSDSFVGYGYFGALMFALIGWIMGRLYKYAVLGLPWAMFLYPLLINEAMFAVTESTARFFSGGFFALIVTLFLFYRPKLRVSKIAYRPSLTGLKQ